jgi:hypothetical protein
MRNMARQATARDGGIPESWNCVDCGVNTAPKCLTASQVDRALAASAIAPDACKMTIDESSEVFTVKPKVWQAACMEDFGGCLCIGCLEVRIGRRLTPKDFPRNNGLNIFPGTARLLSRRDRGYFDVAP